jgi:hypothetical protein
MRSDLKVHSIFFTKSKLSFGIGFISAICSCISLLVEATRSEISFACLGSVPTNSRDKFFE